MKTDDDKKTLKKKKRVEICGNHQKAGDFCLNSIILLVGYRKNNWRVDQKYIGPSIAYQVGPVEGKG